jgi:hypothetical protein
MTDDDDGLTFDEESERSWRRYLNDFKTEVYPVFAPFGFTLPEAFLAWQMNRVNNNVSSLSEPE